MFNTFLISFKLKITYKTNTVIYSLKQIPIIKKILPSSLYQNEGLKIIGGFISLFLEFVKTFLGKFLYLLLMVYAPLFYFNTSKSSTFLHLILILTLIGSFFNTYMFNPTKDKFYAMFLMRMNAKKYTISNYFYEMIRIVVGFLPFTIIFGLLLSLPLYICFMIPFFIAAIKILVSSYFLNLYERKGIIRDENHPIKTLWVTTIVLLAVAYLLPFMGIVIPEVLSLIIMIISIIGSIFCIRYLFSFSKYREIYKIILSDTNMDVATMGKNNIQVIKDSNLKNIDDTVDVNSNKEGFSYFNEIFVRRHQKLLVKSMKRITFVCLILLLVISVCVFIIPEFKIKVNEIILVYLPYFVFIMYLINRGQTITQAMFMNCDHSMLTYSIYKKPSNILSLFKERLKTLVGINLIPAAVIGLGLPILLFITGGSSNPYHYLVLFVSIISMSIFFSVHHLVLYYLLQPYNVNSETKSAMYGICNGITYFVCYYMIEVKMPIMIFGVAMIVFSAVYFIVALLLVYRYAHKTFRLRL